MKCGRTSELYIVIRAFSVRKLFALLKTPFYIIEVYNLPHQTDYKTGQR